MIKLPPMTLNFISKRPEAPAGFDFVTDDLSTDGHALFLFIGDDPDGVARKFFSSKKPGFLEEPKPHKLLIISPNGKETKTLDIPPMDISMSYMDKFTDGRILFVNGRSCWRGPGDYDKNAAIYDPHTEIMERICLGDGISEVAIDGHNRIWVTYFDEGVFGNYGWGMEEPGFGFGSLVCFDTAGKILWAMNDYFTGGNPEKPIFRLNEFVEECWALNVAADGIHFSCGTSNDYYFCSLNMDFSLADYCCPPIIGTANAFAVSNHLLLLPFGNTNTLNLYNFKNGVFGTPERKDLYRSDKSPVSDTGYFGKGSNLHLLNYRGWFRIGIDDFLAPPPT